MNQPTPSVTQDRSAGTEAPAVKGLFAAGVPVGRRPGVMVVDDEPHVAASIADLLRKQYRMITAGSGRQALALLEADNVAVLISDQRMPEMGGVELLTRACADHPQVVRILLTGYADLDSVVQAVNQARVFFYLAKPVTPDQMQSVVAAAVAYNRLTLHRDSLVTELRQLNTELERRVLERTSDLEEKTKALEKAMAVIADLARTDPLTGAGNRRLFDEVFALEVGRAARKHSHLSLLLLDLDHFKAINDMAGHLAGDVVLQGVVRAVQSLVRACDLVARYGGEEFLVLLPETDLAGARALAERLRQRIEEEGTFEGYEGRVTASFGVATAPEGQNAATLFKRADAALYAAKLGGRNRVITDADTEGASS
jgi:diguanylate cyclase (GGDEF)-like protein